MAHTIDCCACGLCEVVCSHNCIERVPAERKSANYIKGDKCTKCGCCDLMCPLKTNLFHDKPHTFFKAISLNEETLKKSSSGGFVHELACAVIDSGGIVYGAAWSAEFQRVMHIRVKDCDSLAAIQGSKYVQSVILPDVYKEIKNDLKTSFVLFIGTPCEVAAVRSFTHDSERLLSVDLICHGVSSPEMLEEQINMFTDRSVKSISFRNHLDFIMRVDDGKRILELPWEDIPYYSLYMHFASLREYCYRCRFACNTRVGDITVGDYVENGNGYSCVISNTNKGLEWINKLKQTISFNEQSIERLKNNHAFNSPSVKHKLTDSFSKLYAKKGLLKAYNRIFWIFRFKRKTKKMLGVKRYNRLKRLLKKAN